MAAKTQFSSYPFYKLFLSSRPADDRTGCSVKYATGARARVSSRRGWPVADEVFIAYNGQNIYKILADASCHVERRNQFIHHRCHPTHAARPFPSGIARPHGQTDGQTDDRSPTLTVSRYVDVKTLR